MFVSQLLKSSSLFNVCHWMISMTLTLLQEHDCKHCAEAGHDVAGLSGVAERVKLKYTQ